MVGISRQKRTVYPTVNLYRKVGYIFFKMYKSNL